MKCTLCAAFPNWAHFHNNNSTHIQKWTACQFIFKYFQSLFIRNSHFDCISLMYDFIFKFFFLWKYHSHSVPFGMHLFPIERNKFNASIVHHSIYGQNEKHGLTLDQWSVHDLINYWQKTQIPIFIAFAFALVFWYKKCANSLAIRSIRRIS